MRNEQFTGINNAIVTKMAYERCESYISAVRAILHMAESDEVTGGVSRNLSHILSLMSLELEGLSRMIEENTISVFSDSPQECSFDASE